MQSLYRLFIELTNNKFVSHALMKFSRSGLSKRLIPSYSRVYKLNMGEVEKGINEFESLHELFTRKLKKGARIVDPSKDSIVSPVDAVFEDFGEIKEDRSITVKGKVYSIEEMLGNGTALRKYIGGAYMVLYLSPSHYHRIHAPLTGTVSSRWTLGSRSYPVNKLGMKYGKEPLSKNYRQITELSHESGHVAIVKVGAMFVNSIELTNDGDQLEKGEEFAYFSFGSTIVLLFEKGTFELNKALKAPTEVRYGEVLGRLVKK
ncbi:MAG: phosphatidylserine decarboxylase [Bacillus sp. (in: firmicutes)]